MAPVSGKPGTTEYPKSSGRNGGTLKTQQGKTPLKPAIHLTRFSAGDRVYQLFAPDHAGTVSQVNGQGFRVTYDSKSVPKGRRRILPRERFWYTWGQQMYFMKGNPS